MIFSLVVMARSEYHKLNSLSDSKTRVIVPNNPHPSGLTHSKTLYGLLYACVHVLKCFDTRSYTQQS